MRVVQEKERQELTYTEVKEIIQENLATIRSSFIAVGYYLKYVRNRKLYLEDGYQTIWEFAEDNYGLRKSTASRWMAINDRFSENGNSPLLADQYKDFGKSQLQEMLYLTDEQIEQAEPEMTAKEIRAIRKPEESVAPVQQSDKMKDVPAVEVKSTTCPPGIKDCIRQEWGTSEEEQKKGAQECKKCWEKHEKYKKYQELENSTEPENEKEPIAPAQQSDKIDEESVAPAQQSDKTNEEPEIYEELSERSNLELLQEEIQKENQTLEEMKGVGFGENDVRVRKQKLLVAALAGFACDLDIASNSPEEPEEQEEEPTQPELPILKNNDQRKAWLQTYKDWGLWYEDQNIGCKYYKYDFENGARLIAEVYPRKDKYLGEHETSYLHLIGTKKLIKQSEGKWNCHETYSRYPNSDTELVQFLKFIQKGKK